MHCIKSNITLHIWILKIKNNYAMKNWLANVHLVYLYNIEKSIYGLIVNRNEKIIWNLIIQAIKK